jgi:hypothetical protein
VSAAAGPFYYIVIADHDLVDLPSECSIGEGLPALEIGQDLSLSAVIACDETATWDVPKDIVRQEFLYRAAGMASISECPDESLV